MHSLSALVLVLVATGTEGSRVRRSFGGSSVEFATDTSEGYVSKLWSFGAPPTGYPALENPRTGGCFEGALFMSQNDRQVDGVPLANWSDFSTPKIDLVILDTDQGIQTTGCPGIAGPNTRDQNWDMHGFANYCGTSQTDLTLAAGMGSELRDACWLGFNNSYESDASVVAHNIAAYGQGWQLLGGVAVPENFGLYDDVSNLIMNQNTGICILSFEGSDSPNDWAHNFNKNKTEFCGLQQKVHEGFSKELMQVVGNRRWQTIIRPKLKECGEVQVVGHSLGGSMASLFAACANNPNSGSDYGEIGW